MSLAPNHSLKMTAPAVTALSLVVPTVAHPKYGLSRFLKDEEKCYTWWFCRRTGSTDRLLIGCLKTVVYAKYIEYLRKGKTPKTSVYFVAALKNTIW